MRREKASRRSRALSAFCAGVAFASLASNAYGQGAPRPAPTAPAPQKPQAGSEDRPYDGQLLRLAEILGTLHYLRELCGAAEGQLWREQMREIINAEGTSPLRRAKLVEGFNRGYHDYARTYRTCTQPALVAIQRFMDQAVTITDGLVANEK